jgi:hypothetical protein
MAFNAPADPDGFTLALFSPNVAIDARGRVLEVAHDDWVGIVALAAQAAGLPLPDSSNHCWRIEQRRTSWPIDKLWLPLRADNGRVEWRDPSVYGYEKGKLRLSQPVGDRADLPEELHALIGLLREGRDEYKKGMEDAAMIAKVKDVIGELEPTAGQ